MGGRCHHRLSHSEVWKPTRSGGRRCSRFKPASSSRNSERRSVDGRRGTAVFAHASAADGVTSERFVRIKLRLEENAFSGVLTVFEALASEWGRLGVVRSFAND